MTRAPAATDASDAAVPGGRAVPGGQARGVDLSDASVEAPAGAPAGASARPRPLFRAWLWAEMALIFFAAPGLVALWIDPARRLLPLLEPLGAAGIYDARPLRLLLPLLIAVAAVLALVLALDPSFDTRRLWNWRGFRRELPRVLLMFLPAAAVLLFAGWALTRFTTVMDTPDGPAFLRLPREAPWILLFIAIGYPWFSAYPQEISHRAFFFHRYREILPGRVSMYAVNAAAFSWLHSPFWNWIALALTLPAGVIFAWTYDRSKSTLAAGMEHALYGWFTFFTGLGWFVFAGSIGR